MDTAPASPASHSPLPVLHAVTNDEIVGRGQFIDHAREVMRALGARGVLQLRASHMAADHPDKLLELALTLAEEQERTGAWLVLNDRLDIALIACARGVQLTTRSLEVIDALQVIMKAGATTAIGASVHSLEEGISARLSGAAWAVAGKDPESGTAPLESLVRFAGIPIVAIGGILPQHVPTLRRRGAHAVAAIRGIWDVDHPERAVTDYLSAYDSAVGR